MSGTYPKGFVVLYFQNQREALEEMKKLYPSSDAYRNLESVLNCYEKVDTGKDVFVKDHNDLVIDDNLIPAIKFGITGLWDVIVKGFTNERIKQHIESMKDRTLKYSKKVKKGEIVYGHMINCRYFTLCGVVPPEYYDDVKPNEFEKILLKITMMEYELSEKPDF